jgi:hypothetical protein
MLPALEQLGLNNMYNKDDNWEIDEGKSLKIGLIMCNGD